MTAISQTILKTERLVLRRPEPTDAVIFNEAIRASFAELKTWMPWCQQVPSIEQTRQNIENLLGADDPNKEIRFLIFDGIFGELVGCVGVHPRNPGIPRFEIGYWIDSRKSGRGYMTEAVAAVTDFALNQLNARRVEIHAALPNERSWKIPERLGYVREAVLHNNALLPDGTITDTIIYAKFPA